MRVHRFHAPGVRPGPHTLATKAAQHVRVLRLKPGSKVTVFNGKGMEYEAEVATSASSKVTLKVGKSISNRAESPLQITLAQSIARGEKKAVELGARNIVPLFTERCNVKLADSGRIETRIAHWTSVLESAAEQCGRSVVPTLAEPILLVDWLQQLAEPEKKDPQRLPLCAPKLVMLLIGSEGGFTDDEVAAALARNFAPTRFGPRILRAETAPLAALAVLQAKYGDLLS